MDKIKRYTITRRMSLRDYINLAHFFETGERERDLSTIDPAALAVVELRKMRLTQEEKELMDEFLVKFPLGVSADALMDAAPKIGSPLIDSTASQFNSPQKTPTATQTMDAFSEDGKVEVEPPKITNFPHWIKDKTKKIEASNIDLAELARVVEDGEMTSDEMKALVLSLGTPDWPERVLAMHPSEFEDEMDYRYNYAVSVMDVIDFAAQRYSRYMAIMNEVPPTEEENAERYLDYILALHHTMTNKDAEKAIWDMEEVTYIADNKIVFDNEDEKTFEYESAEDMEKDFLCLVYRRKMSKDSQVDIFGKKTTAAKIAQRYYKKFPHGISEDKQFYHSRKEAFEDGAITV